MPIPTLSQFTNQLSTNAEKNSFLYSLYSLYNLKTLYNRTYSNPEATA